MYHRKYCHLVSHCHCHWVGMRERRTWDVQTLLNVTNAKVCAIMDVARSFFATARGMSTHERSSWGKKARDSMRKDDDEGMAEVRYRRVLYGEKLWRWSIRVTWWKYVCTRNGWP